MGNQVKIQVTDGLEIAAKGADVVSLIRHMKATDGISRIFLGANEPLVYTGRKKRMTPFLGEAIANAMLMESPEDAVYGCASTDQVVIESFLDAFVYTLPVLSAGAALPPCFDMIFRDDWIRSEPLSDVIGQSISLLKSGGVLMLPYSDAYRSAALEAHQAVVLTERGMVRYLNRFFWHQGVVEDVIPLHDPMNTRLILFRKYPETL